MRHLGPRCLCLFAVSLLAALALASTASAHSDHKTVRMLDDCDAASFNAALGAPVCSGDGKTLFQDFVAEVSTTGAARRWAFNRDEFGIDAGGSITIENRGGEPHTFTEVQNFGGGCVNAVNGLVALGTGQPVTPVPECPAVADGIPPEVLALAVFPGGSETIPDVGPGVHKFQCLIHPWMRSIAVVGDDEGKGGED